MARFIPPRRPFVTRAARRPALGVQQNRVVTIMGEADYTGSTLTSSVFALTANGSSTTTLTGTVYRDGELAVGVPVTFTVERVQVGAATSQVTAVPATIANDGVDSSFITVTALTTDSRPLPGIPAASVVLAATGTGNTLTQPAVATDQNGQVSGSLVSTVAATKVASATVAGQAITDTAGVVVSGSPVTPDVEDNFSTYTSIADFLTDPRNIYSSFYAGSSDMALDTGVGLSPSTQSLRYNYPSGSATDYEIYTSLTMPGAVTTEVWVEAVVRFSSDFTINGNGQGAGPALKLLHVNIASGGPAGRFAINLEGGNASVVRAEGPNDDYSALYITGTTVNSTLFDATNHTLRYHVRLGASDFHEFWVDGVYQGSATGATAATGFTSVSLCKNLNMLAANAMELWWLNVDIYGTDPGWT